MNPIIFLWAHPRSMSTAIERVMRERGDFDCLHEPFLHYYYLEKGVRRLPHFDAVPGRPTTYGDTRDWILERAEYGPVFAKDMSYYVMPELLDDSGFCRRINHCFLVRDPRRAILSFYRLDPAVSLDEIGIEAQWRLLEGLRGMGIDARTILEAESVQRDPAAAIGLFWRRLGLDYRAEALDWDSRQAPDDWRYVSGWHEKVSASTGIETLQEDAIDGEFEYACRDAPHLGEYLAHHAPYYESLRAFGLTLGGRDGTA